MSVLPVVWPLNPGLPAVVLNSARLVLQPPRLNDWPDWHAVRSRNQTYLQPFEPAWPDNCLTRDFFKRRLKRQRADWDADLARYFLIRRAADGALIGGININNIHMGAARHGSLGYWLAESCQGQGYMSESVHRVIDYAFNDLHLQRVHAACVPENVRSMRLLTKIGMNEEGFAKEYIQINGVWRDHHLFGLTRRTHSSVA